MFTLLCLAALTLPAETTPVASQIDEVTLYANTALVVRHAALNGTGTYALTGLPWSLDPDNVRVKCAGGDVLSVELRTRQAERAPSARLQKLRDSVTALTREKQTLDDERAQRAAELEHLTNLLRLDSVSRENATPARSSPGWNAHWQFVSEELARNAKAARETQWRLDETSRALAAAQAELGELQSAGTIPQRDIVVEVSARGAATLEVGYFVPDAGWQPAYDVRTAADLSKASLSYRARVWQQSGEDWNDVHVALSTAQPQRGAQGPDPAPRWISLVEPRRVNERAKFAELAAPASEAPSLDDAPEDRKTKGRASTPRPFASVRSEGLSVRFDLPGNATIVSRTTPTMVLVGAAELAIAPERHCVPALDPTVWLHARATNTSPWVLLPGRAAVFFGSDYFGEAEIGAILPGQELTLHLGADPAITVKRETVEDLKKEAGLFSSRASKIDSWRVHVENHGAVTTNADGSVLVIVREMLPKARDERVDVKLSKATPAPSDAERWKQDRAEKGFVTWELRVPKNGATDLVWQTTITYPQDLELLRQ